MRFGSCTLYGVAALTSMSMHALERRGAVFMLAFAVGCVLSSAYGFLSGAWPFGVVELIWAGVAGTSVARGARYVAAKKRAGPLEGR